MERPQNFNVRKTTSATEKTKPEGTSYPRIPFGLMNQKMPEETLATSSNNIVEFQHNWKIPDFPNIFKNSRPKTYMASSPIEIADATISIVYYPKGKTQNAEEAEHHSEVYLRLDDLKRTGKARISYHYGLLTPNGQIEEKKEVSDCQMEIGYLKPKTPVKWMESKLPVLKEGYLHNQDNSLVLHLQGSVTFECESNKLTPSTAVSENGSELMVCKAMAKLSPVVTGLLKVRFETEECILANLYGYPKWSDSVRREGYDMLKSVFHAYNLDEFLGSSNPISINSSNVAGVLLASDICEDQEMKNCCFKFLKNQKCSFIQSHSIKKLESYAPTLYTEIVTEVIGAAGTAQSNEDFASLSYLINFIISVLLYVLVFVAGMNMGQEMSSPYRGRW